MNKFIIATLISLSPYNFTLAEPNSAPSTVENPNSEAKLDPGCVTKKESDTAINNGGYEILIRGTDPLKRVMEVWFNGKKEVVVLSYESPKDNKPENIKEVCVIGFGENIIFNGDAIDLLKKALDKVNPKT